MFIKSKIIFITAFVLILISLTCVNAADNQTNTIESDMVTEEILTDESNDIASFTELNELIGGSDKYIKLEKDYTYNPTVDKNQSIYIPSSKANLVIDGQGHTLNGDNQISILKIDARYVTLKNINFINGYSTLNGGAISSKAVNLKLDSCNFTNNVANESGGAVFYCTDSLLNVNNCIFTNNKASSGGALFIRNGEIYNSIFTNNNASSEGGAISLENVERNVYMSLINNIFISNSAPNGVDIGYSDDYKPVIVGYNNTPEDVVPTTFKELSYIIYWHTKKPIILDNDYVFTPDTDEEFVDGLIINAENLTIDGNGHTLNGAGIARIFKVNAANVTFKNINFINANQAIYFTVPGKVINCNFTNNTANDLGGALYFEYDGFVEGCIFKDNYAKDQGGAVYIDDVGTILNSKFINNTAGDAGAVYLEEGVINNSIFIKNSESAVHIVNATINNSTFIENTAYNGGAVYVENRGTILKSKFINNSANNYGGAIHCENYNLTIKNCDFKNNSANVYGGAVYSYTINLSNCSFEDNSVNEVGGAVYIEKEGYISNCSFENNSVNEDGGAVYIEKGNISDSSFTKNSASFDGGAVYSYDFVTITNSLFVENKAYSGGAISFHTNGAVDNCKFYHNHAAYGGAVNLNREGSVLNSAFSNNFAEYGGAIYFGSSITVNYCNFTDNRASNEGGAISSYEEGIINNSIFANNSAMAGGAIYMDGEIINSIFTDNHAIKRSYQDGSGGAVYLTEGSITDSIFTNNDASNHGGAVFMLHNGTVNGSIFENNSVKEDGGAISLRAGGVINGTDFKGNNAKSGGAISTSANLTISNSNFRNNIATDTINNVLLKEGAKLTLVNVTPEELGPLYSGIMEVVNATNITYHDIVKITLKVMDDKYNLLNNGSVSVIINGKTYSAEVANGTATIEIPDADAGNYDVYVSYTGEYGAAANAKFSVFKHNTTITAFAKSYMINYNGKYSITLKDAEGRFISGQKVTFTLNGKAIGFAVSDANGVATITLTTKILKAAKAGSKNLVVKFSGTQNYNPSDKTVKITVNKEKTKITAKKKTFKKSAKVKKYTITLKNSKGKAVKKVKVTLKIKGKTFKAKTNSKGKATFKIKKLTKKGGFTAKISFKGNAYYLKTSKKVKIRIK